MSLFNRALLGAVGFAMAIAPAAAQESADEGRKLVQQRCAACHSIDPGTNKVGPSLAGVVGRKAGSLEGARFSNAMRDSQITWDAAALEKFLAGPRQAVPGTTMMINVANAQQRSAIIAFLATLSGDKPKQ